MKMIRSTSMMSIIGTTLGCDLTLVVPCTDIPMAFLLPLGSRAVMKATGAEAYNVLQNNGAGAHQAVFHVHFHVIPKMRDKGLGIGWQPSKLDPDDAKRLVGAMQRSLLDA
jgi:diadenosine tetraphosphate (Ap4A) HIT family hydrolase